MLLNDLFCIFVEQPNPLRMIFTITLTISTLVIINFLLLKFSSNKIIRTKNNIKKPVILHPQVSQNKSEQNLAPTGS